MNKLAVIALLGTGYWWYKKHHEMPAPVQAAPVLTPAQVAPAQIAPVAGILSAGQILKNGQSISSPGGVATLSMQTDGNLVLYRNGQAIWNSQTSGAGAGAVAIMQTDGNFVVYGPDTKPLWSTQTGSAGSNLILQDDGNMVVYSSSNSPQWSVYGVAVGTGGRLAGLGRGMHPGYHWGAARRALKTVSGPNTRLYTPMI